MTPRVQPRPLDRTRSLFQTARRRLVIGVAGAAILSATHLLAQQTQVFTFNTNYQATGLSQWATGAATNLNYSTSVGASWNQSVNFGGFTTGFFGDEWGAGGTASTSGDVAFNASFSTNGGTLDLKLPNKIRVTVPADNTVTSPTIGVTQDRSALGSGNIITSTFPSFSFSLGAHYNVDARVDGRIAYGVGSASGTITLNTLFAAANPYLYAASQATGIDPFNLNFDNLLAFNGTNSTVTILGKTASLANGITKDILSTDVLPFGDTVVPTSIRLGSVTVDPFLSALNAASGSSLSSANSNSRVFGASLDILGAVSAGLGLPINPFDLNAKIPGTPINIQVETLRLSPHLDVGLSQTLTLHPNTYLGLSSNYNVTYLVNGQQVVTKDLLYLLPDNASATSSFSIVSLPTQADFQLFSRVFVSPQLQNQLFLTFTGGVDIQALKAFIGAYGAGVGVGPLIDQDYTLNTSIPVYDQTFDLAGGNLSRVYRNPVPLFGLGVVQNLTVGTGDAVSLQNSVGSFGLSLLPGDLSLKNFTFTNSVPLTITSTGSLTLSGDNGDNTLAELPKLTVAAGGVLSVEPNSELSITGEKNASDQYILDANGKKTVGFVDANGLLATGTFLLGGTLSYDGPDILSIGSGARVELLPSTFVNGSDLGRRFNNFNGQSDPDQAVDGLRLLNNLAGTLIVSGQDLHLTSSSGLTNSGSLTVTGGYDLTATGNLTNTSTGTITIGNGSSATFAGLASSNLSSGTLSNLNLTLGDAAGSTGGLFAYAGSKPTTLASSTSLTLSGTAPSNGFFQASGTDGLTNVTANAGTLKLQNGATQSVGGSSGGLANSGTLQLGSGSTLTVSGAIGNTGTLTLSSGGALNASGTLSNLGGGTTLTGGTWTLGGLLTYSGNGINSIASGTNVTIDGAGHGFSNGGNPFTSFTSLAGSLTVTNGASLTSSATLATSGSLTLGANATVTLGGLSTITNPLSIASGATLTTGSLPLSGTSLSFPGALTLNGTINYSGTNITGIAAGTTINVNSGGTFTKGGNLNNNGWAGLGTLGGTLNLTGGTVRTDAALSLASGSTLTLGSGGTLQVTGTTFTPDSGTFTRSGGTLNLGGNGTETTWTLPNSFTLSNLTVDLGKVAITDDYATTTGTGKLTTAAGSSWTNTSQIFGAGDITGGTLTNQGAIRAAGGTLTLSGFAGPVVNSGILGSFGTTAHPATLVLDNVDVTNFTGFTKGQILNKSNLSLLNGTTVNGGSLVTFDGSSLTLGGASLTLDLFNLDGDVTVLNGAASNITAPMTIGGTGSLTLQANAQLAFATGSTLTNRGLVTFGGGSTITGLAMDNFGEVDLGSGTTHLSNINNGAGGTINLLDGSTLNLTSSTFSNGGLIHLSGEQDPNTSHSTLLLTGDLTLTGGGTIQLGGYNTSVSTLTLDGTTAVNVAQTNWANAGSGTVTGTAGQNYKLTLANQQLIGQGNFGDGQIAIDVLSGSAIGVYGSGSILNINTSSGGFLNQGTLNVGPGATMNLSGGPFRSINTDGDLVEGTYRVGGTLKIPGLNTTTGLDNGVSLTFDGATSKIVDAANHEISISSNLAAGSLTLLSRTMNFATTSGTPFTNAGRLTVGSGAVANFTGGHLTNFGGTTLTGGKFDVTGTLRFDGANIVTNASDLTLRGTSWLITDNAGTPQNALRNFATNNGRFAVVDKATYTVSSGVGTFNQGGTIAVGAGSTLDFNTAVVNSIAASTPAYFIAGTLKAAAPFSTDGATITLFGKDAHWQVGSQTLPLTVGPGGRLVFAGGIETSYAGNTTITNNGLIEIGSPTAPTVDGGTTRSGGFVMFGNTTQGVTITGGGTLRVYGGVTDDQTQLTGTFVNNFPRGLFVDRLTLNGTLDVNGPVMMGTGGQLIVNGVLSNTTAASTFLSTNASAGSVTINGGLSLTHAINRSGVGFNFNYTSGSPLSLDNVQLVIDSLNLGLTNTAPISLSNGSSIKNSSGASLLNFTINAGNISFTNNDTALSFGTNAAAGSISLANTTLTVTGFNHNAGTIANTGSANHAQINSSGSSFTNDGVISGIGLAINGGPLSFDNGGTMTNVTVTRTPTSTGDFNNGYTSSDGVTTTLHPGVFSGTVFIGSSTGGNLTNSVGSTFTGNGTAFMVENRGTMAVLGSISLGQDWHVGSVLNTGDLTFQGNGFVHAGNIPATINNSGTVHVYGTVGANFVNNGDIRINDPDGLAFSTELTGFNSGFGGDIFVDSGNLFARSDSQLGPTSSFQSITVASGAELTLNALTLGSNRNVVLQGGILNGGSGSTVPVLTLGGTPTITGTVDATAVSRFAGAGLNLGYQVTPGNFTVHQPLTLDALTGVGTLTMSGGSSFLALDGGSSLFGTITVSDGISIKGSEFTTSLVNNSGVATTFRGGSTINTYSLLGSVISGSAPITVTDHTNVIFGANEIYTGTTTIDSGSKLTLGVGGAAGSVAGNIVNNGTLQFNRSDDFSLGASANISGNGGIVQGGTGTLTILSSSFLNNLTVSSGVVQVGNGSLALSGTLSNIVDNSRLIFNHTGVVAGSVTGTGTLEYAASGDLYLTHAPTGSNGIYHYGTGLLSLPAGQTFTGSTQVGTIETPDHVITGGGGKLLIAADSSLGTAPATYVSDQLLLNNGTLQVPGSITLAATRGVAVGSLGGTFEVDGSLTIPTALNGFGGVVTKTGGGTLSLISSSAFDYAAKGGTLWLDNAGNTQILDASVDSFSTLRLSGAGNDTLTAPAGGINGNITVDAGTLLQFFGNVNARSTSQSIAYDNGQITVAGTLRPVGTSQVIDRVAGTGTFEKFAGDLTTVNRLEIANVNLSGGDLATTNIDVATFTQSGLTTLFTTTGRILDLVSGGGTIDVADGGGLTVSTLTIPGAFPGNIQLTKEGKGALIFDNSGTLPNQFSVHEGLLAASNGTVFNGVISGAGGFFNFGGSVTLAADNTYTGGTSSFVGDLIIGNGGTSGSVVGAITTGNFGINTVSYKRSDTFTLPNTLLGLATLRQAGTGTLILNSDLKWTDSVTDPVHPFDYNRNVTVSSGTVRIDDGATSLGTLTTNASLVFNNTNPLTLNYSGPFLFSGAANITGTGSVTQAGAGTTTLGGIIDWTGGTTISAGTLALQSSFANAGGATVASGGTLAVQNGGALGGTVANAGTIALQRDGDYVAAFSTTGSGDIVKMGTGSVILSGSHTNDFVLNAGRLGTNEGTGQTVTFTGGLSGPGEFFHSGTGTLNLSGGASNLGGLTTEFGTLRLAGGTWDTPISIDNTSTLAVAQDLTYNRAISGAGRVRIENNSTLALTGTISGVFETKIDSGSTLSLRDGSTYSGGALVNNGLLRFDYTTDTTFAPGSSGTGDMTIGTPTRLTLTGQHTATGTTTIPSASTLALADGATLAGTVVNNGTFEVLTTQGSSRLIPANITGSGNVAFSGGGTIEVLSTGFGYTGTTFLGHGTTLGVFTDTGVTTTFSHLITGDTTGPGTLLKTGDGTLVVAATSAFDTINIHVGTLQLGNGGNAGYLSYHSLIVDGTLAVNLNYPNTIGAMSGQGGIHQMGSGALTLTSDNPLLVGDTTVDAHSTLNLGDVGSPTGSVGGRLVVNGTLNVFRTGDFDLTAGLTGTNSAGIFEKQSAGSLILRGTTDFAGEIKTHGDVQVPLGFQSHRINLLTPVGFTTTLTNDGSLTVTGNNPTNATINIVNNGTLTLGEGGTSGWIGNMANVGRFINNGTLAINRSDNVALTNIADSNPTDNNVFGIIKTLGSGNLLIHGSNLANGDGNVAAAGYVAQGTGTLEFENQYAAGTATVSIAASATALLHGGGGGFNATYSGMFNNSGRLKTDGDLTLSNGFNTLGTLELVNGNLTLPSPAASVTGDLTLTALYGSGNLIYTGTGDLIINSGAHTGQITSSGDYVRTPGSSVFFLTPGGTLEYVNANTVGLGAGNVGSFIMSGTGETIVSFGNGVHSFRLNSGTLTFASGYSEPGLNPPTYSAFGGTLKVNSGVFLGVVQASGANVDVGGSISSLASTTGDITVKPAATVSTLSSGGRVVAQSGSAIYNVTLANTPATSLDLTAGNVTMSSLSGGGSLGGNTNIGSFTPTLSSGDYAGAITGSGGLIKDSGFGLTLSGANTFTGPIDVRGGSLALLGANLASSYAVQSGATLTIGSSASLGTNPLSPMPSLVTLHNGRLDTSGDVSLFANQGITLDGGGSLGANGSLTINNTINGTGTLTVGHGRVLFNGSAPYANAVDVIGTFGLGNVNAIDPTKTTFQSGSAFDVFGHDWSTALSAEGVTIANYSTTPATVTSALTLTSGFGLNGVGSLLTFNGTLSANAVTVETRGTVAIGATPAPSLGTIAVHGGNATAALETLTAVTAVTAQDAGRLQLTGTARDLTWDVGLYNGGTFYNDTNGPILLTTSLHGNGFNALGGTQDLTLAGAITEGMNLAKVGPDRVTIDPGINVTAFTGSANYSPLVEVRGGTLSAPSPFYDLSRLTVGSGTSAELNDDGSFRLRSLDGAGTVNLGNGSLTFYQDGNGVFTGSLVTNGTVTHNSKDLTLGFIGPRSGTQTYGSLTAGQLIINSGDVTITDAVHVGFIDVTDQLTMTINGASSNGGTNFTGAYNIEGTMRLLGGNTLTSNSSFITLGGFQALLLDNASSTHTLSHVATNTGQITVFAGANVTGAAPTFTNTGRAADVLLFGGTWTGFNVINNQPDTIGEFSWDGVLAANRFNQISVMAQMFPGGSFIGPATSSAVSNPGFVLSGGAFNATGLVSGGLAVTGGLLNPGNSTNGPSSTAVGTLETRGGLALGGGSRVAWDFSNATGAPGTGYDRIQVTNMPSTTNGQLSFSGTAASPVFIDVRSADGNAVTNFNPAQNASWTIASTTDGLVNFNAGQVFVNGANFTTAGNFGVAASGNDLQLVYNPSQVYTLFSFDPNTFTNTPVNIVENNVVPANGPFGGIDVNSNGTSGTLTLNAANLFTGASRLRSGIVVVGNNLAFGTGPILLSGGTVQGDGTARTLANPIQLISNATLSGTSNLTFTGPLYNYASFNPTVSITNTGTTTFGDVFLTSSTTPATLTFNVSGGQALINGVIANGGNSAGRLTKSGSGTLTLLGNNTYTGVTTVSGGTLQLGNAGTTGAVLGDFAIGSTLGDATLAFNRSNTLNYTGVIANRTTNNGTVTVTGIVAQTGTGTTLLSGANTFTGEYRVTNGALALGNANAIASGATVSLLGGYLDLNGFSWSRNQTLASGGGFINSSASKSTLSGQITATSLTLNAGSAGGTLDLTGSAVGGAGSTLLSAGGTRNSTVDFIPSASTFEKLAATGDATFRIGNATALAGVTDISGYGHGQFDFAGTSPGASLTSMHFSDRAAPGTGNAIAGDIGGLINSSPTSPVTINTAISLDPFGAGAPVLMGGLGDLTLQGSITGSLPIAKIGTGTLTLASTYSAWSGNLFVREGTLTSVQGLFDTRQVFISVGASLALIGGGTPTGVSNAFSELSGGGNVSFGSGSLSINQTTNTTFSGTLDGGALSKSGSGTLTLSGNVNTASLNVTGGEVNLTGTFSNSLPLTIGAAGRINLAAANVTSNGGATFTGKIDSSGTAALTGMTTALTANAGSMTFNGSGGIVGNLDVTATLANNNGTLRGTAGANIAVANAFTNAGAIDVSGSGTTFNAGASGTGAFAQAGGTLAIGDNAILKAGSVEVTGGTVTLNGTAQLGSGALTLSGGIFKGHGDIIGSLVLSGGNLSPGNSPGELSVTDSTWNGGASFTFEFNALPGAGTAGTNWDLLTISHALNITASGANPFVIQLVTLTGGNLAGLLAGFDPSQNYTWDFVNAGSLTGFAANAFSLDLKGIANSFTGQWAVALDGTSLELTYTASAIPEPGTYVLFAGLGVLGFAICRRRKIAAAK